MQKVKIINSKILCCQEKEYAEKLKNEILAKEQTVEIQESAKKKQHEPDLKDKVK